MFTIVCYDIANDRRRDRVFTMLQGYGTAVQESVFECDISARQMAALRASLRRLIDPAADHVRCYLLDVAAIKRVEIIGAGVGVSLIPPYYLVGPLPP